MVIKIIYGNFLNNLEVMDDWMTFMMKAVKSLGHSAEFEQRVVPNHVNIVFDGFNDEFAKSILCQNNSKTPILLIATEFITGTTFNTFFPTPWYYNLSGLTFGRALPKHARVYKKRYNMFCNVASNAAAIWILSQNQLEPYKQVVQSENVFHLQFGFLDSFRSIHEVNSSAQDIDFLFTGSLTPFRQKILDQFNRKGRRVYQCEANTPQSIRNSFIERSRAVLNIRQNSCWPYPSTMRMYYHLMNKSLLISEKCPVTSELDEYILRFPSESFVDQCIHTAETTDLHHLAEQHYESFRAATSMKSNMDCLLEKSLSFH